MDIQGGCHCGNITFDLAWPEDATTIRARACGCTFCTRHGGVWTSHPAARLTVRIADSALLSRYAFGTQTATFHVCARCGVVPVVTSDIDGGTYAVVNVNAFAGGPAIERLPATFDGEDVGDRLARRKRNWIAEVSVQR